MPVLVLRGDGVRGDVHLRDVLGRLHVAGDGVELPVELGHATRARPVEALRRFGPTAGAGHGECVGGGEVHVGLRVRDRSRTVRAAAAGTAHPHSVRRDAASWTRAARRAGHHARSAATPTVTGSATTSTSHGVTGSGRAPSEWGEPFHPRRPPTTPRGTPMTTATVASRIAATTTAVPTCARRMPTTRITANSRRCRRDATHK